MKPLLLICMLITSTFSFAQIRATTEQGKAVVLMDNGTWKYAPEDKTTTATVADCSTLIMEDVDKMTGKTNIYSNGNIIVSNDEGKTGLAIMGVLAEKTVVLSISAVGAGRCIEEEGKINILFSDGERIELINQGGFNCKGRLTLYFRKSSQKTLTSLTTKNITTMRVWTNNGFVERDLNEEQQNALRQTVKCLMDKT